MLVLLILFFVPDDESLIWLKHFHIFILMYFEIQNGGQTSGQKKGNKK